MEGAGLHVPENVRLVPGADHDAIMREASVVVTHAGHGTVMRALAHGLPMLCLPMGRDQNDNAARAAARGAGIRLPREAPSPEIAKALQSLLTDPAWRRAAATLGDAIADAEPPDALTIELEALAAARTGAEVLHDIIGT